MEGAGEIKSLQMGLYCHTSHRQVSSGMRHCSFELLCIIRHLRGYNYRGKVQTNFTLSYVILLKYTCHGLHCGSGGIVFSWHTLAPIYQMVIFQMPQLIRVLLLTTCIPIWPHFTHPMCTSIIISKTQVISKGFHEQEFRFISGIEHITFGTHFKWHPFQ